MLFGHKLRCPGHKTGMEGEGIRLREKVDSGMGSQVAGWDNSKVSKDSSNFSLNIFHRPTNIQPTSSDLFSFCLQQVLDGAQLALLRALFEPAKMVCNQVSKESESFCSRDHEEMIHTCSCILDIVRARSPSHTSVL